MLASIARLLRRTHDAAAGFDASGRAWNPELADPLGGPIVCHNDVCLENVVFRDGEAVGFLDFDFAAPGRPVFDVASFARMCVPVDDDLNAARLGWFDADRPELLRVVVDEYGLATEERLQLIEILTETFAQAGAFVRRRVEAGEPGFVQMWTAIGGQERFDRRIRWWEAHRDDFSAALR